MSQVGVEAQVVVTDPEQKTFWGDLSTKAIVAAVLLAVGMVVGEQIAERVDTLLFGGVVPIFGIMINYIFEITGLLAYGLGAGLIIANLNPFVSLATATGPLSPLWFMTNTAAAFGGRIVHHYMIRKDVRNMTVFEVGLVCLGANILDDLVMLPIQILYFQLPIGALAIAVAGQIASAVIIPALIAWKAAPALKKIRSS